MAARPFAFDTEYDEWAERARIGHVRDEGEGERFEGQGWRVRRFYEGAPRARAAGRPRVDGGTTFHFQHAFVSKAAAVDGRQVRRGAEHAGRGAARQLYIEGVEPMRRQAVERDSEGRLSSFGSIGPVLVGEAAERPVSGGGWLAGARERGRFWEDVAAMERANGRVQCAIIEELPHEMSAAERRQCLKAFCEEAFGARGLPYWAVVHVPDEGGDERNFHGHVVYHDRPGRRGADGGWEFDARKARALFPWGTEAPATRERRLARRAEGRGAGDPRVARELGEVRDWRERSARGEVEPDRSRQCEGIEWISGLRRRFAEVVTRHLEAAGHLEIRDGVVVRGRRYDPRSYVEMGIDRIPGDHLGPAQSSLERNGQATRGGMVMRSRLGVLQARREAEGATAASGAARELLAWAEAMPVRRDADAPRDAKKDARSDAYIDVKKKVNRRHKDGDGGTLDAGYDGIVMRLAVLSESIVGSGVTAGRDGARIRLDQASRLLLEGELERCWRGEEDRLVDEAVLAALEGPSEIEKRMGGRVPPLPEARAEALALLQAQGLDRVAADRLKVLVGGRLRRGEGVGTGLVSRPALEAVGRWVAAEERDARQGAAAGEPGKWAIERMAEVARSSGLLSAGWREARADRADRALEAVRLIEEMAGAGSVRAVPATTRIRLRDLVELEPAWATGIGRVLQGEKRETRGHER